MQLYNYLSLMPKNEELVVFDTDYNFKTNYYKGEDDELRILFLKFADSLTVTQISAKGVAVKLASTIKENIKSLEKENLFEIYDIEYIMSRLENILGGNVDKEWMKKFIQCFEQYRMELSLQAIPFVYNREYIVGNQVFMWKE